MTPSLQVRDSSGGREWHITKFSVGTRAQAILKPLLLRRTKNSEIEGAPILQLPPKDIELVQLQFTEEEREVRRYFLWYGQYLQLLFQIYDSFEKQSKITINRFIRNNTLVKS